MATALSCRGDVEHAVIEMMPRADGNVVAGRTAAGDLQPKESASGRSAAGELQRTESGADDKVIWKQLKSLNYITFYIEFLEYLGNAVGTVAFLWATVVLLGGFCSLLNRLDFWFATIMVFLEGTRVFISKDATVNQWLFGSTTVFRWDHFCFSAMHGMRNLFVIAIGSGISLMPIKTGSQITVGILKVATLAITILLLKRRKLNWLAKAFIALFLLASLCGCFYVSFRKMGRTGQFRNRIKPTLLYLFWFSSLMVGSMVVGMYVIDDWIVKKFDKPKLVFCLKVIVAIVLVLLPVLQAKIGSNMKRELSLSIAAVLLAVNWPDALEQEEPHALLLGTWQLILNIADTIMPILYAWAVIFPLPGFSLKVSFYMLLSVIAAVLVGNLQIPVAFLQILLSSLRLHSLRSGHHHPDRDYHPLSDGASPNLVPSIIFFFALELCQGSSNILGVILGLFSFACRRSLVCVLGLKEEWLAKAVNMYYHQAFMTIKAKGLFPMEKSTPPSIDSFAIESLGCTSSEMQIVRLQVLDHYLRQQAESKSRRKLIAQIEKDATGFVTKISETISHLITDEEINSDDYDKLLQIRSYLSVAVDFVWLLVTADGKFGTRIRQELSGNPILLHSLQRILDMENCPEDLRKKAMDAIKWLALNDKTTAKETRSTHAVIPKLMDVFLSTDYSHSLRKAAGEELANLTITSSDNCRTILAGPVAGRRNLIKNLIAVGQHDKYKNVAANLRRNLYANSGDMLIDIDPHSLESDLLTEQQEALRRKAAPSRDEPLAKAREGGSHHQQPKALHQEASTSVAFDDVQEGHQHAFDERTKSSGDTDGGQI